MSLEAHHLRSILMDLISSLWHQAQGVTKLGLLMRNLHYSAPNANSKLGPDGTLDILTQERALLNKVSKLLQMYA